MIYKTVPNCRTCSHPLRKEIEDRFLLEGTENFLAFSKKIKEEFIISPDSLRSHFKGINKNGGRKEPHFCLEYTVDKEKLDVETQDLRREAENRMLKIVNERLYKIESGVETPDLKELNGLLKTMVGSQDARRSLDIKEKEVKSKQKNFDKLFNSALYGDDDEKEIRDAELVDDDMLALPSGHPL